MVPAHPGTVQSFDGALRFCMFGDMVRFLPTVALSTARPDLSREVAAGDRSGASLANWPTNATRIRGGLVPDQAPGRYSNLFFG
jgi:hypothetical protein